MRIALAIARASYVSVVMRRDLLEDRVLGFSRERTAPFAVRTLAIEGVVAMALNKLGVENHAI